MQLKQPHKVTLISCKHLVQRNPRARLTQPLQSTLLMHENDPVDELVIKSTQSEVETSDNDDFLGRSQT